MASKALEIRMKQKEAAETGIEAVVTKLKAAGMNEKQMAKNPLLRQAKARLRKSLSRINAINLKDATTAALAKHKAEAATVPKKVKEKKTGGADEPAKSKGKKDKG